MTDADPAHVVMLRRPPPSPWKDKWTTGRWVAQCPYCGQYGAESSAGAAVGWADSHRCTETETT